MTRSSPTPLPQLHRSPMDLVSCAPIDRRLVVLHSGGRHPTWGRWSILAIPEGWVTVRAESMSVDGNIPVRGAWAGPVDAIGKIENALRTREQCRDEDEATSVPFAGGWIGAISYELGQILEPASSLTCAAHRSDDSPLLQWAWCPNVLVHDHSNNAWWSVGDTSEWAAAIRCSIGGARAFPPTHVSPLRSSLTRDEYVRFVRKAKEYIAAGDVFQVNFTQRFHSKLDGSARRLFVEAMRQSEARYGSYLECPESRTLISCSPELFFQLDARQRRIITRPVKGTLRDEMDSGLLGHSRKDAAELHMIVDLMRNDLGRICELGSVQVDDARRIETHPSVHHGVGEISGRPRQGTSLVELLRAIFPGGSITGAPKIRAMQIIEELEPEPRGPYCGAIGYLDCRGNAAFNIAIRTMVIEGPLQPGRFDLMQQGRLIYGAGGGIVADSNPAEEYEECLVKTEVLRRTIRSLRANYEQSWDDIHLSDCAMRESAVGSG